MGQCVVIVSHPRSGTHFTIDFLRRNFADFRYLPMPWVSSESLYFNLDWSARRRCIKGTWSRDALERNVFLVKTHDLPFAEDLEEELIEAAAGREVIYLYPFRRMSKTLLSFRNFIDESLSLQDFVQHPDTYFETEESIEQAAIHHAEWALEHAVPLDIEAAIQNPQPCIKALSERFGWTILPHADPLPPKRKASGKWGEIIERLKGRQSSEVVVRSSSHSTEDATWIDNNPVFHKLYTDLKSAAII